MTRGPKENAVIDLVKRRLKQRGPHPTARPDKDTRNHDDTRDHDTRHHDDTRDHDTRHHDDTRDHDTRDHDTRDHDDTRDHRRPCHRHRLPPNPDTPT